MGLLFLLVLGIIVGGYLVLFSHNNPQQVSLNLLAGWYLHEVAVWQLVVFCLIAGVVAAALLLLPAQWRTSAKARAFRRELKHLQKLLEAQQSQAVVAASEPAAPEPEPEQTAAEERQS
jgi:uncharacterized membrane protein YciS (DUF1049 family)